MKPFLRRFVVALCLGLVAAGGAGVPARATINSTVNKTIVLGDGVATTFNFSFVGVAAAYISVIFTDASGNETVLTSGAGATQYQISLNPPATGAIWGLGGTVTYNPSGTPIAVGTTLTIFRTLPLTQAISLQRMNSLSTLGNGAETGLDTGAMQLQQVSENIARAIVAPIVDATPPAPLPPIAQRANHGAAFDGQGNLVAGVTPSSGVISSAMQPVVNAATLAAGRAAFGLGNVAVENIGAGLQDDGAGNLRVNSGLTSVAVNQAADASFAQRTFIASGPIIFTLARANTLWNGYSFDIIAFAGSITLTPNAGDNFPGQASGASYTVPAGSTVRVTTDAANTGTWYAELVPAVLAAPQGYLTPCSQTVVVTACTVPNLLPIIDATGVSTLYYQPAPAGNQIPIWNGASMVMIPFPELTLTLNASHLSNTIYDACVALVAGVPTIMTAPAWSTSTAGAGARGGAAAIARRSGMWTNSTLITGRNGATTYSIPANQCTIVASISVNAAAGQVSLLRSYGQSRKWGVWNFYNRQKINLKAGDPNGSWSYLTSAWRPARNDSNDSLQIFAGLPEENFNLSYSTSVTGTGLITNQKSAANIGIGYNSLVSPVGKLGATILLVGSTTTIENSITANYLAPPAIGINVITALENGLGADANLFSGTEGFMLLAAEWRG